MNHRMAGRKFNRNASHRAALLRNLACSLILTLQDDSDDAIGSSGRIVTTLEKAKALRSYIDRLVTIAKRADESLTKAASLSVVFERNSVEWKRWRQSEEWVNWCRVVAPAVALRRRAFSILRSRQAVDILFKKLPARFGSRHGGYTRVVRLAEYRLGDSGRKAIIEFCGLRDRV